ncbi:hypothetical protein [Rhodothermus profundi]|uniref:Uncharacterized protein n=1 Tax=Rhodothermus profundi TaxID=633813 RepID=A0A1M6PT09_9BACT|nr:hypothetical protein [Rhodothermus profundi]SHK11083.1 hypothetical protein SAMN04488087_0310 [Rhodothermus profundi]
MKSLIGYGVGWGGRLLGLLLVGVAAAQEQEIDHLLQRIQAQRALVWTYRAAWLKQQAAKWTTLLPPRPPELLPVTLYQRYPALSRLLRQDSSRQPRRPRFTLTRWRVVRRFEQRWFQRRFGQEGWAYLGSNSWTPLDTLRTAELRARLQAHFGNPTRTLAEVDLFRRRPRDEYIQFEYWLVLNDSIPFRIMDVNGPLERGLVVASAPRYRDQLWQIRQALLGRLIDDPKRAPFVDYYYQPETDTWYLTGFDGQHFFLTPIRRPARILGRPRLSDVH